ncbi:MAG TPA: ABC transporter substrate-binding protein, partial [Anaerolineae bacterium]|nr:ABC transporter substrate-binding protein [Anaerolineae bacterium]
MRKLMLSIMSLMVVLSLLVACGPTPAPQVVEKIVTQEVEKTVIETVEVEKTVVETVEVEKEVEVVVTATPGAEAEAPATSYERSETLYVSGAAWGPPSSWNPFMTWVHANTTGIVGNVYETLYVFNPQAGEMGPWLAESAEWTDANTWDMVLREGITWSDGEPMTAEDIVFSFELGQQYPALWFSSVWNYLDSVTAVSDTEVQFKFTDPLYQEWEYNLYHIAIVPKHLWEGRT